VDAAWTPRHTAARGADLRQSLWERTFGVGWNSGWPEFNPHGCNPTYAQDASAAPITLTVGSNGDRFCLDGKRLRLTSGGGLSTYGQDNTTYQTEVADFSNITAHGTSGQVPVTSPSGVGTA